MRITEGFHKPCNNNWKWFNFNMHFLDFYGSIPDLGTCCSGFLASPTSHFQDAPFPGFQVVGKLLQRCEKLHHINYSLSMLTGNSLGCLLGCLQLCVCVSVVVVYKFYVVSTN